MFIMKKQKTGFTLIELLVVLSILGLMTAIIFPSFAAARKKSRVGQRVSDMKQVEASLAFYYAVNRSYPTTGGIWRGVCPAGGSVTANNVIPGLAPTFIPSIPSDPQTVAASDANCYLYRSDGADYAFKNIAAELAVSQSVPTYAAYPELFDPANDGGTIATIRDGAIPTAWKVFSAGGAGW